MSSLTVTSEKLWHSKMSLFISHIHSVHTLHTHLQVLTTDSKSYIISVQQQYSTVVIIDQYSLFQITFYHVFALGLVYNRTMGVLKVQLNIFIQQFNSTCRQQKILKYKNKNLNIREEERKLSYKKEKCFWKMLKSNEHI